MSTFLRTMGGADRLRGAAVKPFLYAMGGPPVAADPVVIEVAGAAGQQAHQAMRQAIFVERQGLFAGSDRDEADDDPATIVLVARAVGDRSVLGGVRVHPCGGAAGAALGWWRGSRLVVDPTAARARGANLGARLVRAATALADERGALRFDATVQPGKVPFFTRLGWRCLGTEVVAGVPHALLVAPSDRFGRLVSAHKLPLGRLLAGWQPGGPGFVGDDAAPVPGIGALSRGGPGVVAACDSIVPAMVERDPEWAGWCSVLVNVNDLAAMGAQPVGLLDAVAGRDERHVARILSGLRAAADAYGVPVLGGHTHFGGHSSLAVTALGTTWHPVPAGGGQAGDDVRLVADLEGGWRPGYGGQQWDSSTHRSPADLRRLIRTLVRRQPAAAKDVSMTGMVGTLAMLAEASGTGAEIDVASVPAPAGAALADWLTCFPGFALLTADRPGTRVPAAEVRPASVATIGRLTSRAGVRLGWPDGHSTIAVTGAATGLGRA